MDTSNRKNIVQNTELATRPGRARRILEVVLRAVGITVLRWIVEWVLS